MMRPRHLAAAALLSCLPLLQLGCKRGPDTGYKDPAGTGGYEAADSSGSVDSGSPTDSSASTSGVPPVKAPLSYSHLEEWAASGDPSTAPESPDGAGSSVGTVDLGTYLDLVGAAGDVPAAARLVLPDYSYFQGYAQSGQGAEVVGPVRVVGGLFAAGVGQSTTLAAGAMLTTAPDYLEAADAGVRRRYQVLEWKESSGG